MKHIRWAAAWVVIAAAGCGFADVPGDDRHGSVTAGTVESRLLGDTIPVHVYLPPDAGRNGERLPVVYLLHGYGGNEHQWFAAGRAHETADRLMADGTIPRAILVTAYGGRYFYVNSPRGRWSDFFCDELPSFIESNYPARTDRGGRVLVGNSMGGWGALYNGLQRPERFTAVASLSGVLDTSDWSGPERMQPIEFLRAAPPGTPLPAIYADCGTADRHDLHLRLPELHAVLAQRASPAAHRVVLIPERNHTWSLWQERLEPALVFATAFITPGPAAARGRVASAP